MEKKIKICGLKKKIELDLALSLGADYAGLVFYPPSIRFISPKKGL